MATVEYIKTKLQTLIDRCKTRTRHIVVEPEKDMFTSVATELTSGTSLSASVECQIGDLVICAIATRDTLAVSSGWTLISTSGVNSTDTTNQRLSWAYKYAENTTETITVTQASSQRLYINMVALTGATSLTDNGYSYCDDETIKTMTVAKPSGLVLWGATAPLWESTDPYDIWTVSNTSPIIQIGRTSQSRLAIVLDQSNDLDVMITGCASTMIIGSLTIEGIDEFYIPPVYGDTIDDLTGQIATLTGLNGSTYECFSVKEKLQNLISACQVITGDITNDLTTQVGSLVKVFIMPGGLYDVNDELVASERELVNDYGMDTTSNYTDTDYYTKAYSPYNVLKESSLSSGVKLVISGSRIGNYALKGCRQLISIVLRNSIKTIGAYAFEKCTNLTEITIPGSVTDISGGAFSACTSLSKFYISDLAAWCNVNTNTPIFKKSKGNIYLNGKLITNLVIPDGVTTINSNTFCNCISLTNLTIPDNVTLVGGYAFSGCENLYEISIPDNYICIGSYAFENCTNLSNVTIPDSVTNIGMHAFNGCSNIEYNQHEQGLYLGNDNNPYHVLIEPIITDISSYTFADGVKGIGGGAFYENTSLTNITIPDSVVTIGPYAFEGCSSLTDVVIPGSVTLIGSCAFYKCRSLTSITIPEGVTSIGSSAFSYCSNLTSIVIPDSVTEIGSYAFEGCRSLTSITIPEGVTSIGFSVFNECRSLTSIVIPDSVTSIDRLAFNGCTSLASIVIPNSVTSIGELAFDDCSGLTSIVIPNSVTSIDEYAFRNCTGLTSVVIPDSVTSIEGYTFYGCSGLKNIVIPDGVTKIGSNAFQDCSSLTSVVFPGSVTSIGYNAFYKCSSLTNITFEGTVAQWNAISISPSWNQKVPATKVVCSDGTVTL